MLEAYDDKRHACGYVRGWYSVSRCKKNTDSMAGFVLLWTIPAAIKDDRTGRNQELGIRAREGKAEAGKPQLYTALQKAMHPALTHSRWTPVPEGVLLQTLRKMMCWPLQPHSLPFSLLCALGRVTFKDYTSMAPLFLAFLLGLADEKPQQEIAE